jgi:hypothetical protein
MMKMIVIAFISCIIVISAQPEGWRMIDRFYGFRYSINLIDADSVATIRQFADALGCFGWIQNVGDEKYVGEARCSKSNGIKFEEAVRSLSSEVETKVQKPQYLLKKHRYYHHVMHHVCIYMDILI